jgi:hypothetical protein
MVTMCALEKGKMQTMSSQVKPSKAQALAHVQALIAGTQKHTPNGSLTFGGTTYPVASLVQLLQGLVAAMASLNAVQASAKDAMSALRDVQAKVGPVLRAYRRYLIATYGNATQTLADYGLEPPKARTPLTSAAQATAVLKLRATRKARGTTSKKQKAAIKGTVETTTGHAPAAPPATPAKPAS